MRQTSESLAGRMEHIVIGGLSLAELGSEAEPDLWLRGVPIFFLYYACYPTVTCCPDIVDAVAKIYDFLHNKDVHTPPMPHRVKIISVSDAPLPFPGRILMGDSNSLEVGIRCPDRVDAC